jgi:hypothetical protein
MRSHLLLFAAGPLIHAGCTVGPDYVKPSTDVPTAYKEPPPAAYGDAGQWQQTALAKRTVYTARNVSPSKSSTISSTPASRTL